MADTIEAQKKLVEVGTTHSTDIMFLLYMILGISIVSFIILYLLNQRKPKEERRSLLALFLIALNIGFFSTAVFFVYKYLMIGLQKLAE